MANDVRAVLLIDGPPAKAKYCEGCPLFEVTDRDQHCPYFGDVYQETEEPNRGCHCRPPECHENESRVFLGVRASSRSFQRWVASPTRDAMEQTRVCGRKPR